MVPYPWGDVNSIRSFLAEPAVADPPARVWRDWALLAAIWIAALVDAIARPDLIWPAASLVVCLAASTTVLWRRTHPLAMTIIGFGLAQGLGIAAYLVEGESTGLYAMAFLLVLPYALFRWASGRHAGFGVIVIVAAWVIGVLTDPGSIGDAIGGAVVLFVPVELGAMVRYRAAAHVRELEEARLLEREQLARELHDTVAHHVSAIAVQAQAGRHLAATMPDAAVDALGTIEEAASRTLDEMRALVSALRRGEEAELAPLPGVAEVERLAASNGGGPAVRVELAGDLADLRPSVDTTIYRLAQESITNALRHARHATRIDVRVAGGADAVRLTVCDDGEPGSADAGASPGYGLRGMAERAELMGGTFTAGPGADGGWTVDAVMPRNGSSPA